MLPALLVIAAASLPRFAVAQEGDSGAAEILYRQAKELQKGGKLAEACPKFEESYRLDPTGTVAFALARCLELQGKTASAWTRYQEARTFAAKKGATDKVNEITAKIAELEPTLAKLVIRVSDATAALPSLVVKRDGVVLGQPSWGAPLPVDPGPHSIEATAPGKRAFSTTVPVDAKTTATFLVPNLEDMPPSATPPIASGAPVTSSPTLVRAAPSAPAVGQSTDRPSAPSGSSERYLGYGAIGLGVVGVTLGAVFLAEAVSKNDSLKSVAGTTCSAADTACISSQSASYTSDKSARDGDATIAMVGFGVGGALAVGGVVLLLVAPSSSSSALTVTPLVGPGERGFVAGGAFLALGRRALRCSLRRTRNQATRIP